MDILYVGLKHNYNRPAEGPSFEQYNFYETLVHMGYRVSYFDFGTPGRELGIAAIVDAGYARTLAEHLYEKCFQEIFARMGFA